VTDRIHAKAQRLIDSRIYSMHECVECEMLAASLTRTFFRCELPSTMTYAKAVDIVPANGSRPPAVGRCTVLVTQGVVPSAEEQKTRPSSTPVRTRKEKP
jgi:hypothetical protein